MNDDLYYQFSLPHLHFSLKGWEIVLFELGSEIVKIDVSVPAATVQGQHAVPVRERAAAGVGAPVT